MIIETGVSTFDNKESMYSELCGKLEELLSRSGDDISNLANASALLALYLKEINWVGFYLLKDGVLKLGPFQGKPAVAEIKPGDGVCGTALVKESTMRVDDVHSCDNHIVCDAASSSELVVPLRKDGRVIGVLDIDSPLPSRFDELDEAGLLRFAAILSDGLADL